MTSSRKRKREAQRKGLTLAEWSLCELLEQVLAALRWQMVLGYANQYLVHERLSVPADERDRVMRAAAAAVEADGQLLDWGRRLQAVRAQLAAVDRELGAQRPAGAADGPGAEGAHGG